MYQEIAPVRTEAQLVRMESHRRGKSKQRGPQQ